MGAKAFGVQSPTEGEDPVSWQTWSDGAAAVPTIDGDADWGKLKLDTSGEEGRSAVYDLGSAVTRLYTLTENRYGTGNAETRYLQIRGDTSSFLQDAAIPAFETYTDPISRDWRYVQIREITPSYWTVGATYPTGNGVICIRFDDGKSIDYTFSYPALVSRGLVAGFAISADNVGDVGQMTAAQLREMEGAGMEMMCHSATHSADPASFAEFVTEAISSKATLEAMGLEIASFAQPGSWVVDNLYRITDTDFLGTAADIALRNAYWMYQGYIQYWLAGGYFSMPFNSAYRWGAPYISMSGGDLSLAQMKAKVDDCITNGYGMITLCHAWALDDVGETTSEDFLAWLDYLEEKQTDGDITVLTPTQFAFATAV